MNYISFSLWGDKPIYNIGAIRNSELCKTIYKGWKVIVYYDNTVPISTIKELENNDVELINMSDSKIFGCFWRFLVSDRKDCEFVIFRDCDSRVSIREMLAVNEWILSKKTIHIMRDHPAHKIPYGCQTIGILAGMWGIKGNVIDMETKITEYIKNKKNQYGIDQSFLCEINKSFENDNFTHDEFFIGNKFPIDRTDTFFVGSRIDENEKHVGNDHLILLNYENRLRTNGVQ